MKEFIQQVPIYHNGIKEVMADLYKGFPEKFLESWKNKWKSSMENYIRQGREKPEHSHWNWLAKGMRALLFNCNDDSFFWIDYDSITQGIMWTEQKISHFGKDFGERNIYISFLEVAPWNYYKDESVGYYKSVGSMLLMAAVRYSDELGYGGRIALETLPQSREFYLKYRMIPVKKERSDSQLLYLELSTQNAEEFLRGFNR